jgi:hypothetical protein
MIENLSSTEKHEILFKRFINIYKHKTYSEMCCMTLEIKTSDISEFENRLKDALIENINQKSMGILCSIEIVISRLIDNNEIAKDDLINIYNKIQVAKQKI